MLLFIYFFRRTVTELTEYENMKPWIIDLFKLYFNSIFLGFYFFSTITWTVSCSYQTVSDQAVSLTV
jgi:hypothetical protein